LERTTKSLVAVAFAVVLVFSSFSVLSTRASASDGVLNVAFQQDPISLNGIVKTWNPVGFLDAYILLKLVTYSSNYTIVGEAAQSWTTSADGKSITFNLRHDIVWADGVPFNSTDVAWHYKMLLNGTSVTTSQLTDLVNITTPDAYTVTFTFASPRNYYSLIIPFGLFSTGADQYILPYHIYHDGTTKNFTDNPVNTMMIGDAAFTVKDYVAGQYLQYVPNPHYFGSKPKLNEIVFSFPYTPTTAENALESGQVNVVHDSVGIPLQDLNRLSQESGITVTGVPYTTTWRITFNFEQIGNYPWVNNTMVRQAFSMAIDRNLIISTILGNITTAQYGPISSLDAEWYNPNISKYTYNVTEANALLDQAGYPRAANGTRFSAPMVVYLSSLSFAQVIQQELSVVGINVNVIPVEDVTFFSQYETGPTGLNPYPIAIETFGNGPLPANMFAWTNAADFSPNGQNCGFYNNTQVNQLENEASSTLNSTLAHQLVDQVQAIISHDVPYVFLWSHWKIVAFDSNVQGIVPDSAPVSWYGPGYRDVSFSSSSQSTTSTSGGSTVTVTTTAPGGSGGSSDTFLILGAAAVVIVVVLGATLALMRRKRAP
jgi:peptide/nickel transport system substrate-binding protein